MSKLSKAKPKILKLTKHNKMPQPTKNSPKVSPLIMPLKHSSRFMMAMFASVFIVTGLAVLLVSQASTPEPWQATYIPHGYIATVRSAADTSAKVNDLKTNKFNVQLQNIGAFDTSGAIASSNYAGLSAWITTSRSTDPNQKIIGWLNGTESAHVNNLSTHSAIASWIANFVSTTGVNGVMLDFEPFTKDNPNYIQLITKIRQVNPNLWIGVNAPGFTDRWNSSFMHQVGNQVNAIVPMIYDTTITTSSGYVSHVTSTVQTYKQAVVGTTAKIYPSIPAYNDNAWHSRTVENIANAANGIRAAGGTEGGAVYWWYEMTAEDKLQWSTALAANTFSLPTSDISAPTTSISAPTNGAILTAYTTVSVSASDNIGVTRVELYRNNNLVGSSTTSPYQFSWDVVNTANGVYSLVAKAYDAAGNVGTSTTISVTVNKPIIGNPDTQAPVVAITPSSKFSNVGLSFTVNATATDNVGVTAMEVYIDGIKYGSSTSGSLSVKINSSKFSKGYHNLVVKAYDAAGNVGQSSVTIKR